MKEVLTLQFGAYSNYIGSHYWNFQDELFGAAYSDQHGCEVDNDVLYAYSEDKMGNTVFTPRALIFDLAGSEGMQRALAGSAATSLTRQALMRGAGRTAASTAEGEEDVDEEEEEELVAMVEKLAASQLPDNPFFRHLREQEELAATAAGEAATFDLDLESLVTSWGDYAKSRFQPRSLLGIGSRTATGDALGSSLASTSMGGGHGVSPFDAFSYGSEFFSDSIEESVRLQLENCDGLQGVQAVVDIDSGFGSLAVEVLAYLRDECPRAPFLVFGAVPPRSPATFSSLHATVPGPADYAGRERTAMRDVNVGLAFTQFATSAGADLDALFVPFSLQPYADAVADATRVAHAALEAAALTGADIESMAAGVGPAAEALNAWLPGLKRLVSHRHYQTSAILAAGWDTTTLAFRRNADRGDRALPFCRTEAEDLRREMSSTGSGVSGGVQAQNSRLQSQDSRTRQGGVAAGGVGAGAGSTLFDPALEHSPQGPLVGLSSVLSMSEFTRLLTPAPCLRVATLSLALPTPHPRASATVLDKVLARTPPLHACRLDTFTPLSWVASGGLPRRMLALPASTPERDVEGEREGEEQPGEAAPFSHLLSVRGVGTHNVGLNGGYASTTDAYGRVLDTYMSRTRCRTAGHTFFRTPLPLPITFPRVVPGGMYDYAGAFVGYGGMANCSRPPTVPLETALARALQEASALGAVPGEAISSPFSLPVMAHLANTPAYGPCLSRVHAGFVARDRSILHRYAASDRTSSRSNMELLDAQAILASLADDYAGASDEY